MSKKDEALKLALEALEYMAEDLGRFPSDIKAITAIREALAEQPAQQQEPVAWRFIGIAGLKRYMTQKHYDAQTPETKKWYEPFRCANCTTSPQSKPLTDEDINRAVDAWFGSPDLFELMFTERMRAAIEAAHGIKGDAA